jgi:hypothetical protein
MAPARPFWWQQRTGLVGALRIPTACLIALLAVGALIFLAPFGIRELGSIGGINWSKLSYVAQTYAAAAAVLGTLAILGVALSLIMQARESRANRLQIRRTFHNELILKSLEDPELLECWGGLPDGKLTQVEQRQFVYTNLIFAFWLMLFETGEMSEAELRNSGAQVFSGAPARRYWAVTVFSNPTYFEGKKAGERFAAILSDEYGKSISRQDSSNPPYHPFKTTAESARGLVDERSSHGPEGSAETAP